MAFDPYGDGQALPKPPRRQLNKQILTEFDTAALDAIQGEADGFPYQGSIQARNTLFLDTELRTGSVMVGFLLTAKVTTLMGGVVDLNKDPGALSRVTNGTFFIAIRTTWANYQSLSSTLSSGPASTGVVAIRDPDVAKPEESGPQAYLSATYSVPMAFEYSTVTDLRARARQSGHPRKWQEEGNIVERWAKRSLSAGANDPARGDLGKFLSDLWAKELSRQLVAQQGGPMRSEWQPSTAMRADALSPRSMEGPIGFALDVLTAWHAELLRSLQCLARIKA